MKLRPLGDRVVVEAEDELEQKTASGLVIPDTAKEKPMIGEVTRRRSRALNDDGKRLPMDVKGRRSKCSIRSTPAPRSSWRARNTWCSQLVTFWP